ncbi:MAG: protein translocase subunit SecF, partial [Candidatus Pacebacteria bacterium]|nr:protein translocase subunit SecF [Candidatus Paceibacterota bacterium]
VQRRKIWFGFSIIMILASVFALAKWDLRYGVDFTGGTLMELSFKNQTLSSQEIKDSLGKLELGGINVQFSGEKDVILRLRDIDEDTHQEILESLENAVAKKNSEQTDDGAEKINNEEIIDNTAETADEVDVVSEGETKDNVIVSTENSELGMQVESIEEEGIENVDIIQEEIKEKNIEEKRADIIGPVIGNELKSTAKLAIAIALIAIVLYIGWAFRKVSKPVSSFKYGIIATITLFHDIIITLGVFAVLGHLYNIEVGIPFVAALLAILGYSVNDTIVVFDRTRENLIRSGTDDFEKVVNKSVNETLIRSLNTSFTTLLVLVTLFLFGGTTIKYFVVALMVGISAGTYSSIFIASPLLVTWQKWSLRKQK